MNSDQSQPIGCMTLVFLPLGWFMLQIALDGFRTGILEVRGGSISRSGKPTEFWLVLLMTAFCASLAIVSVVFLLSFANISDVVSQIGLLVMLVPVYWLAFRRPRKKHERFDLPTSAIALCFLIPLCVTNVRFIHAQSGQVLLQVLVLILAIPMLVLYFKAMLTGTAVYRLPAPSSEKSIRPKRR